MPLKKWLLALLSLVCLACMSAREPVLALAMDASSMGLKKHFELKNRAYTVTVVSVRQDGRPATSTRQGVLSKETYAEVLRILDGIRPAELQDTYTDKHLSIGSVSTLLVHIAYKGQKKGTFILGNAAPKELAPLLDIFLPLMYT
jgi:hypothetical protein